MDNYCTPVAHGKERVTSVCIADEMTSDLTIEEAT